MIGPRYSPFTCRHPTQAIEWEMAKDTAICTACGTQLPDISFKTFTCIKQAMAEAPIPRQTATDKAWCSVRNRIAQDAQA